MVGAKLVQLLPETRSQTREKTKNNTVVITQVVLRANKEKECGNALESLDKQIEVELVWVPGHMGPGYERADQLAILILRGGMSLRTNTGCRQAHNFLDGSKTDWPLNLGRRTLHQMVGILIGHCRLRKHLHLMGIELKNPIVTYVNETWTLNKAEQIEGVGEKNIGEYLWWYKNRRRKRKDQLLSTIIPRSSPEDIKLTSPTISELPHTTEESPILPVSNPINIQQGNSEPPLLPSTQRSSNFSSVFSSFSNILNLKSQSNNTPITTQEVVVPPPAGIDSFLNQENPNVEPVPLFPAVSIPQPKSVSDQAAFKLPINKSPCYPPHTSLPLPPQTNQASLPSVPLPPLPVQASQPALPLPPQPSQTYQGSLPLSQPVQASTPSLPLPPQLIQTCQSSLPLLPQLSETSQPSLPLPPQPIQSSQPYPGHLPPTQTTPSLPSQPIPSASQQQNQEYLLAQPSVFSSQQLHFQPGPFQQQSFELSQPVQSFQYLHAQVPSLQPVSNSPQVVPGVVPELHPSTSPDPVPSAPPQPSTVPYQIPFLPAQPISSVPSTADYFSQPISAYSATIKEPLQHQNLPNQFKPISPPPPSLNVLSQIPQPLATIPSQSVSQFLQPIKPENLFGIAASHHQSPVMDAIPASEVLQNNLGPSGHYMPANDIPQTNAPVNQVYRPVYHHWFYQKEIEGKKIWKPFSMVDSLVLEQAFTSNDLDPDKVIATDGGRYDVNILRRQRIPVYWAGNPSEVRRCSWFHKSSPDGRLVPYEENVAAKLEEEFKAAFELNQWHRKVELANGETVVIHGPDVLVLFPPTQTPDAWGNTPNQTRPRVVKRGMDEFDIDEGEPAQVDHILFMVHGIGSVCDLKFRSVEEVVDEFRNIALQLVQSHYKTACENGFVHRVEVLPISWHSKLHSGETGIDKQIKGITLESIPKLRDFINDTILDVLLYTSPVYCQTIISTVGSELNRIYDLFKERNPTFSGGVSLGGHSLGSLILFDLLCHQHPLPEAEGLDEALEDDVFPPQQTSKPPPPPAQRKMCRRISYLMGSVGTGQPEIHYPHLNFEPKAFFALGSPISTFVIVRGLDTLGENFSLPTCPAFFNIFHPYDPIAYRIEPLICPDLGKLKPVLIPHHKGRKRMHLELKETMARVGADLKQKLFDSMKSTWNSFYQLAMFHKPDQASLEEEVQKAFEKELEDKQISEEESPPQDATDISSSSLNKGRRIDYVLQEAPFEFINEYIFALTSHVCYWESEDSILLILKEIYSSMGFSSDSQIPQQTMTIERNTPSPTPQTLNSTTSPTVSVDPTRPIQVTSNLQPPPTTGFVRKT
ncbi:hypothetical protein NQ315_010099 [Exocentrus adspersus]|uniref:Phospholipase DDHD2 n=1 Tax=Exocentrus adspersus TaxID=1586481 RepID=A0AAV8WAC9_9CUCU|nr:hypothetical protein NQ315_010099 [Exocentrus adspersus]